MGDVGAISESLKRFGQLRPVVVRGSRIVAGHHVVLAARALGWSHVAVLDVEFADEDEARAFLIADNRTAELGWTDDALLVAQLEALESRDGTGYSEEDLDDLREQLAALNRLDNHRDPDSTPDPPADPFSKPGEVYELGPHRLMCGDATSRDDLAKLMAGDLASVVVTSPPYNQRLDSFKPSGMQRENPGWVNRMASAYADSRPEDEYQAEQVAVLDSLLEFTTETASVFYNHKHRYRDLVVVSPFEWIARTEWSLRQEIVWDRASSVTLNARMFMPVDERIYWLTRGQFDFDDTTEIKSFGTVWRIAPRADVAVSAPFPVELPHRCIVACAPVGGAVMDPYAGSGTVLIAAEMTGRRCFALEVNPAYCDVIRQRYAEYAGVEFAATAAAA